jgi:hypothetical protein
MESGNLCGKNASAKARYLVKFGGENNREE